MSNFLFGVDQVPTAAAIPAPPATDVALTPSQPITASPAGDRQRAWQGTPPRTPKVSAADFLVDDKPPRPWPPAMQRLITWLEFAADLVPSTPFDFRQNRDGRVFERVLDPTVFLERLRADISRGPDGPRARLGVLQKDLRQLRALFGRRRRTVPPQKPR